MTRQKEAVLSALEAAGRTHPTADTIYVNAKKLLPSIALGAVYRNLSIMTEKGEIRRITVPGEPDRFDMDVSRHDHIVCKRCGRVYDIGSGITYIPREALPDGIRLLDTDLVLNCICPVCAERSGEISGNKN